MTTEMTTDTANELRDELEMTRVAWTDWLERWEDFRRRLERAGYNTYRLDAYQVGRGMDEGGGQSMEGWLSEIESDLMGRAAGDDAEAEYQRQYEAMATGRMCPICGDVYAADGICSCADRTR